MPEQGPPHAARGPGDARNQPGAIIARQPLKRGDQWRDVALANRKPLSRGLAIDRGFGGEYRVNLAHGLVPPSVVETPC